MSQHYCDCFALPDGRLGFLHDADGPAIVLEIDDVEAWRLVTPEPLLQLRGGIADGFIVAVGQGNGTGNAWVSLNGGPVTSFGPTFGAQSVCVGPEGVYIVRNSSRIDVLSVANVFRRRIDGAFGVDGIRDVTPEGEVRVSNPDWMVKTVAGVTLSQPCQRGAVIVGQSDPDQIAGVHGGTPFTAFTGLAWEPHVCELPGGRYAVCARTPTEPRLVMLPPFPPHVGTPPPEPPAVIGPIGPSRSADGRLYDLQPFVIGAPETWPRSGPTHPMHQTVPHGGGLFEFVKFGTLAPLGAHYEQWAVDTNWFYLLEDGSDATCNVFSDVRHFPRKLSIGPSHPFVTPRHTFTVKTRGTCVAQETRPLGRSVWILGLWDRFACGPDLGERAVVCLVFDPTEGAHSDQRMIELGYFAFGAGWFRWEAHRSDLVYASGSPVFSDASRTARSDFYRLGGPVVPPSLSGCVPQVVPSYPPWGTEMNIPAITTADGDWTLQHLRNGEQWRFTDTANEPHQTVRVFVRDGGIYAEWENAAGTGKTGAFRRVFPS